MFSTKIAYKARIASGVALKHGKDTALGGIRGICSAKGDLELQLRDYLAMEIVR